MKLCDIHIRDPFILPFEGKYYMYGTPGKYAWVGQDGFFCYVSEDLENWSEAIHCFKKPEDFWSDDNFWAPEVHFYRGKFYLFATFYTSDKSIKRSVQILVSDAPTGPFVPHSERVSPSDWMSLDGTLWVEDGKPYMVFCHEHSQIIDGEMCLVRLSEDLSRAEGEPRTLFKASEPYWADGYSDDCHFVTDGPYIYKTKSGKLLMIWSSFSSGNYLEAVAVSDNGKIGGNWTHCQNLLSHENGGHGMIFRAFDGKLYFTMHSPNSYPHERPVIIPIEELETDPYLKLSI